MKAAIDTHMHSTFSFDGGDRSEEYVLSAIAKGLRCICFTEHLNCAQHPKECHRTVPLESYRCEIARLRELYGSQLRILYGIEFDQPHQHPTELRELQDMGFDMILGSVHGVFGSYAGVPSVFDTGSFTEVMEEYYRLTIKCAALRGIDSIAHFDLPLKGVTTPSPDIPLRREALAAIAKAGMALELNTGGMRSACKNTLPDLSIIRQFAEVGGKRLTIGSDTHNASGVAGFFEELPEDWLCGMELGVFIRREFVPLERL